MNTSPFLVLFALASYPLVADAFLFNILLSSPPRSKWGEPNAMEIPRRDLSKWVEFDYSSDYENYIASYFGNYGEGKQETPLKSEQERVISDIKASDGADEDESVRCQKEFGFRLKAKGDVEEGIREMIAELIRNNMELNRNYRIGFETADRERAQRDYDGSLCRPNDCGERWQMTYLDVGFKVKAFDKPTATELQHFFDTIDFAAELINTNPSLCGAQLVGSKDQQAQKRRDHDEKIKTPRAFDRARKYGKGKFENSFMSN